VGASAERGQPRNEGSRAPDRKGASRQRVEVSGAPGGSPGRTPADTRRRRSNGPRYASWGDGIERAYCTRSKQLLPETFPVESHSGVATIAATVAARRPESILLCTFSHHGPHAWPDGELVDDGPVVAEAPTADSSRSDL